MLPKKTPDTPCGHADHGPAGKKTPQGKAKPQSVEEGQRDNVFIKTDYSGCK